MHFFIFYLSLIYATSFIILLNLRFKDICSTFILIVAYIIDNKLCAILVHIFALYIYFLFLSIFFSLLIIFFNLFNTIIILICLFFKRDMLS